MNIAGELQSQLTLSGTLRAVIWQDREGACCWKRGGILNGKVANKPEPH